VPHLAILAGCYLLGSIPFGFVICRLQGGADIRQTGSGNIGATNVVRAAGWAAGLLTLALDIAKGYVAVWVASRLTAGEPLWVAAAALAVLLGHAFPVFLRFRGGKAVASFVGAYFYLAPVALLASLGVFAVVVAWSRYVSLGSLVAVCCFPLLLLWQGQPPRPLEASAVLSALLIVWRHRENIQRLLARAERRLGSG
jgi:glycerol-3-phosphate acyltransferase PlsY